MDERTPEHGTTDGDPGSGVDADEWRRYDVAIDLDSPIDSRAIVLRLVPPGARVLELGCSAGLMTRVMHERGHRVVGVEFDPAAATHAAPFTERLLVDDLDGSHVFTALAGDTFDTILAADVLEHLRDPERCLRQALDHLDPGGSVILSIPNVAHGDIRLALLQGRFDYRESGLMDRTHIQMFSYHSLVSLIEAVGLVPVEWHRCVRPLGDTEVPVDPALLEFGRRVLAGDPDADTYQWIVVCRPASSATAVADPARAITVDPVTSDPVAGAVAQLVAAADAPPPPPASLVDDARRVAAGIRRRAACLVRRAPDR